MLQELDLLYQYELPLSSTVTALIDRVTLAMQNSRSQYRFATTPRRAPSKHLTLLALLNRGVARRSDTQIRLTPIALEDDATLHFLATDRHCFAHEKCIDKNNQFIIHFGQYYNTRHDHSVTHVIPSPQLLRVSLSNTLRTIASIHAYQLGLPTSSRGTTNFAMRMGHGVSLRGSLLMMKTAILIFR